MSISKASQAGATGANLLTRDEARRIARELAQLPELLAHAIMPASRRLNTATGHTYLRGDLSPQCASKASWHCARVRRDPIHVRRPSLIT